MNVLELPTGRLAYWDAGTGKPLVFIHGVGTSGGVWQDDLAPLTATHRVVVYDRRGYGESAKSTGSWPAHIDDAAALIAALGVEKPIVVGYSGGAGIALGLALARPELVGSLVIVDPACNVKKCLTAGFIATQLKVRLLRKLGRDHAAVDTWQRHVSSYSTGGCAYDKAPAARRDAIRANAQGLFADADTPNGFVVDEAALAKLAIPTMLIDAKLSPGFLRKSSERLRRAMPNARTVTLERSGHHIMLDARDEFLHLLRSI